MSIKMQFATLGDALAHEVGQFSPYAMATIVGYGRIGGYSPKYSELRRDVFDYIDICGETLEQPHFGRLHRLRPIVRNRMMGERLFAEERDTLRDTLQGMAQAARQDSDSVLEEQLRRVAPQMDPRLQEFLRRAGVELAARRRAAAKRAAAKLPQRMLPKPTNAPQSPIAPHSPVAPMTPVAGLIELNSDQCDRATEMMMASRRARSAAQRQRAHPVLKAPHTNWPLRSSMDNGDAEDSQL